MRKTILCKLFGCKGPAIQSVNVKATVGRRSGDLSKVDGILTLHKCKRCGNEFALASTGFIVENVELKFAKNMLQNEDND